MKRRAIIEAKPLTDSERSRLKTQLEELSVQLEAEIAQHQDATAVVALDQGAIGRVSRGDALQAQAMAKASRRGLERRLAQIGQALESVAQGTYGECRDCGDPIGFRRLSVRPEAPFCIGCQESRE